MKSLLGHTVAGTIGSTLAAGVIESGSAIAAAVMVGACLCFVASRLVIGAKHPVR